MQFSLMLPGETLFGWGRLQELGPLALRYGDRLALAHGGASFSRGLRERLEALMARAGITLIDLPPQTREPEPEDIDAAAAITRKAGAQAVIAIGGGSVLDLGKAVAALAPQHPAYPVRAYLEDVGEGRVIVAAPLPFIAIPTTAGTGTEATKNAVISSQREGFKKSLRDRRMIADIALIDPELTLTMPPSLTAWTGLDAITQLIEAYTSVRTQPVTDALALRGLRAATALRDAVHDGANRPAREQMALAAYLSGVCLANAGLGAAHGIAAGLGSMAPISHGLACAIALPWVMASNASVAAERYTHIAELLTGETYADAEAGAHAAIRSIWTLLHDLAVPRASAIPALATVLADAHLPVLVTHCHGNSLRGNPRPLNDDELLSLLRAMRDAPDPLVLLPPA